MTRAGLQRSLAKRVVAHAIQHDCKTPGPSADFATDGDALRARFHGPPRGSELGGPGTCHGPDGLAWRSRQGPASSPTLPLCRAGGCGGGPGTSN